MRETEPAGAVPRARRRHRGRSVITGEPGVYGRVHLGSGAARGVLYGEPS